MAIQAVSGYEIVEILGEGPQAIVYKARDPKSRRLVAVKVFHNLQRADIPRLQHRHIAAMLDVGRTDSNVFAVSEYLPGGTLKQHLVSMQSVGDALPPDQILDYAEQIAEALTYAHGQGVAHGNLRPENVMFGEDGTLKLTDFNAGSDTSSDIEGFGRLLFEMSTGRVLLPGMVSPAVAAFRRDMPSGFIQLVMRLLDKARPDHYEDLSSVLRDLKSASFVPPLKPPDMTTVAGHMAAPAPPALCEGRLMAGRFKIVKFIARGGMGDVYEAEDLELHECVALKTIRPEIAGIAHAMERFKREIQLARRVTHPNVCRIFDLFHDTTGSDDITFLTMELLNGETLHQRVTRAGRMTTDKALPIIRQMAAGLAAAHKAGVIHRDFKSSNVMLIETPAGSAEVRAVVTDFGLARAVVAPQSIATLSNPGDALGTPAYMAPEQLEDGEITSASDIYSFGIVMYEMVTARLPWQGESTFALAIKRLQGPPPSPRTYVPELDSVWESTILRCLERLPADRFENVEVAVDALTLETVIESAPSTRTTVREVKPSRSRFKVAIVVALILAALTAVLMIRNRLSPTGFKSRRSIAVLGFKNLTGQTDAAWLSTALAEMLTTELAAGEKLRTIPGENVARMSVELSLPESSSFGSDTLARIRNYIGADVIVYGSYVVLSGAPAKVRMDLRLQDSVRGNLLATISEEGDAADLLTLVSRSGAALRERLGVGKLEGKDMEAAQAALPATPAAARFYADGLEKLRLFDAAGAREALEKAVAEDQRYALARSALATAWSMWGNPARAREQSQRALDLSARLGREDQLVVQGRAREASLEWQQAVQIYRTLFGFFADNLDYGLRLAEAQTFSGQARDALATIETLRKFPPPDRDSPRIDLAEAHAAGALSDFKRQRLLAARAGDRGHERGATLLVAGSKLIEGNALANMGELSQARAAFERARQIYAEAGDHWNTVNASTNLAFVVMQSGDLAEAQSICQESVATYRKLGDRKGEAAALTSLGTVFRNRGDFSRARTAHEQALAIRRDIGDRIGEAMSRNNLANLSSLMGDSQAAREMYQDALPVFREIGDRNAVATVLSNLGDLVSEEGDLIRARDLYEESRATFEDLGNQSSLAHELSRLGDLDSINGDFISARKRHEQALALRRQLGEKGALGESQLALAQISLHEGNPASAQAAAVAAVEAFATANRPDDEASALALLARSLLESDKYAESAKAIQRAEQLSMTSSDRGLRLSVAITAASIRAARGDAVRSLKDLDSVITEARRARLLQLELEAQLARTEIEVATGRFQEARRHLEALEMEALKWGYKYIADRAAAARTKIPSRPAA